MKPKQVNLYSQLKVLWVHISPARRTQLYLLTILMIITSFAEVVSIGAIIPFLTIVINPEVFFENNFAYPIINFLGISNPKGLILPLTIAFILATLVAGLLRIFLLWTQTRLSHAIGADISLKIYNKTLHQKYGIHLSRSSSEIIAAIIEKSNMVVRSVLLPLLLLISSFLLFIVIFSALSVLNPIVTASTFLIFGTIYILVMVFIRGRLLRNGKTINYFSSRRVKALQEGLGGIRHVILDGVQKSFFTFYRSADIPLRRAQASNAFIASSPRFGIEALGMILIAIVTYILSVKLGDIKHTLPLIGAFALGAQRMLPLLQTAYASWSSMRGAQAALKDSLFLLNQKMPSKTVTSYVKPLKFNKNITLKNLSFSYSKNTPYIFKNFNLSINKGSRVGIIGTTGGGKSTLIDILTGLLEPTKGNLIIDNIKINDKNRTSWMANIAYVPQSIFLSDATIAENIAFGIPKNEINLNRVKKSAELAQISDSIKKWKKKYNMLVGERGTKLSGGQRQRIGIARALYKQANVIIFDEATSSLDNKTENSVMNTIYNIDREITIFIVAHRLSSLKSCDVVIEIQNGKFKKVNNFKKKLHENKTYTT